MASPPIAQMTRLLIQGGRVVSPADSLDDELDILIEGERIQRLGHRLPADGAARLDVRGQVVAPGFVDIHVHLREPGDLLSETLETGLQAAVAGGFTAVCPMPNTRPVNDQPALTRTMIAKARQIGLARVFPIAAVSLSSQGEQLADLESLKAAGAVAFSDDGRPIKTAALLRQALRLARRLGTPIIDHCEDPALSAGGVVNAGPVASRHDWPGISNRSEEACVARDIEVCQAEDGPLHIAHLSTAGALETVRAAKRRGLKVTCEVTPHHLALTEEAVEHYGTNAKMNPPLRSAQDREALLEGFSDRTVDAIATDHAPHAPQRKALPMAQAPFGVIGLETAFAVALQELVHSNRISLAQVISLLSVQPARIIRQPLGRLQEGALADLTIFDPQLEWTYSAARGFSKSRNSPFEGRAFRGAVTATLVGGKIVYQRR